MRVLAFLGRTHFYEGKGVEAVVHGVRVAAAAGCRTIVLTNACGGLRPGLAVGDPVLLSDHLNLTWRTPLVGPRFVDLTEVYSPRLRALVREIDPSITEGVYAMFPGPQYETPAEVRMAGILGADLVGMSTVLEAIAARAAGLRGARHLAGHQPRGGPRRSARPRRGARGGQGRGGADGRTAAATDPADLHERRGSVPARPEGSARRCARRLPDLGWTVRCLDRDGGDGISGGRRHVPGGSRRDRARRGRDRAPGRSADRGTVAGDPRREPRRHLPGVRGGAPARRAPGRLRVVQPCGRLHPARRRAGGRHRRRARTRCTASARCSARPSGATTSTGTACRSRACASARSPSGRPTCARCRPGCRRPTARGWSTRACVRRPRLLDRVGHLREHPAQLVTRGRASRSGTSRPTMPRPTPTTLPDAQPYPSDAFVGGGFTSAGFGIDEVRSRW